MAVSIHNGDVENIHLSLALQLCAWCILLCLIRCLCSGYTHQPHLQVLIEFTLINERCQYRVDLCCRCGAHLDCDVQI
jgi:hypothetical protein